MLATGFPRADAENDFLRARRHQFLAALTNRLRGRPADSDRLVPLDEIVGSLGWRSQRQLGLQTIRLDTIAGTAGGAARLRPLLPAYLWPGPVPLGEAGAGPAAR